MKNDELADRVRALEALNRALIQMLMRHTDVERLHLEQMMDSLVDQATGDRAASYHAERLKRDIEGESGSEEAREQNRAWLKAESEALYGYSSPLL